MTIVVNMVLEGKGEVRFWSFASEVWAYICKKCASHFAVYSPAIRCFAPFHKGFTDKRTAVAELQKVEYRIFDHSNLAGKLIAWWSPPALVVGSDQNAAFAIEKTSEVGFKGFHGFSGRFVASTPAYRRTQRKSSVD